MSSINKLAEMMGLSVGSEIAALEVESFLPTIDPAFTWALHGGFAKNRINVLAGDSGAGKTFIAMACAASLQKVTGKYILIIDTEYYFYKRPDRVKRLAEVFGIDISKLLIKSTNEPDEAFKVLKDVEPYMEDFCCAIVDSLGGVSTKSKENKVAKGETEAAGNSYGGDAKMIANTVRIMNRLSAENDVTFFCVQHTMDSMDMYDSKPKIKGGKVLRYTSDTMVLFSSPNKKGSKIAEDGTEADSKTTSFAGKTIRIEVDKCRDGVEGRKCDFKVNFENGQVFKPEESLFNVASQVGVIYHPEGKNQMWAVTVDGQEHSIRGKEAMIKLLRDQKELFDSTLDQCINSKKRAFDYLETTSYELGDEE